MPKSADNTKLFKVVRGWTVKNRRSPLDFLYNPQEEGVKDVTQISSSRTRCNSFKLRESKFRLDIRKKFSPIRVVRFWNRLTSCGCPIPAGVQGQVGWALGNLV